MHLIIVAIAIFMNAQTGEQVQAIAQVDSALECAAVINDNREPKVVTDADEHNGTWYMIASVCAAQQVD